MMNRVEVEKWIERLENDGYVVVNVVMLNNKVDIESWDGEGTVVGFECVTVEQYEANGYSVDGLPVFPM